MQPDRVRELIERDLKCDDSVDNYELTYSWTDDGITRTDTTGLRVSGKGSHKKIEKVFNKKFYKILRLERIIYL